MSMEDLLGSDLESDEEGGSDVDYAGEQSNQESEAEASEGEQIIQENEAAVSGGEQTPNPSNDSGSEEDGEATADNENEEPGEVQDEGSGGEMDNEDLQLPSTQSQMRDLFGEDSDEEEGEDTGGGAIGDMENDKEGDQEENQVNMNEDPNESNENDETERSRAAPTQEDLFGEELDVSSDEEEETQSQEGEAAVEGDQEKPEGQEEQPEEEEEGVAIEIELPKYNVPLGNELYFIKLPNFLSVETKPFDPTLYEDEIDEDEVLDEEGRARLKLKVENTIRWRHAKDEDENDYKESNARIVRWSDGSLSLHLGNEIFDIFKMPVQGEQNHLFVQQGTGLQAKAVFKEKLTFRPHSTKSQTHRKMTMSIADRMSKTQKIRVLPATEKDPESHRQEMLRKEEERMRAQVRRESQQRRMREKSHAKGLTANYLESDLFEDDEQELEESLAAIKNRYKKDMKAGRSRDVKDVSHIYSDDDEEDEDSDADERLMNAKAGKDSDDEEPFRSKRKSTGGDEVSKKKKSRKIIEDSDEDDD